MKELEVYKGLMVREDGLVKNISGHHSAKKDWWSGGGFNGDYCRVKVSGKGMQYVHRLVAKAFIPNPDCKEQVNHINGVKNDNRVCNLEWCTRSENIQHSFDTGLNVAKKGKDHHLFGKGGKDAHLTKLTIEDCIEIKKHLAVGKLSQRKIGELYGVTDYPINRINRGIHWSCK